MCLLDITYTFMLHIRIKCIKITEFKCVPRKFTLILVFLRENSAAHPQKKGPFRFGQ